MLEDEVREFVRRRWLDPAREVAGIRTLVADCEQTAKDLLDAIAGLGPFQHFLDDPTIEEVWINEPGKVFIARACRAEFEIASSRHLPPNMGNLAI
ncbi:hypothetical protein FE251_11960 [Georgenia wutianyii]|uniref:CpaF family protein n=1 Tax=Georgenia wutianyii TaxID=2585135 RepID=A0ABX5VNC7_9MICO|nr:hypothetical protein [Georgenia wutianyii]QDB80014.1 hypothetical protein FE251_11960 [Georgenia wutianyii]